MTGGSAAPSRRVNIAIVGLGFGEDFLPIYRAHPGVGRIAIVDPSRARLDEVGQKHGIEDRVQSFDVIVESDEWDAVHLLAPVSFHAEYTLAALRAGKHPEDSGLGASTAPAPPGGCPFGTVQAVLNCAKWAPHEKCSVLTNAPLTIQADRWIRVRRGAPH